MARRELTAAASPASVPGSGRIAANRSVFSSSHVILAVSVSAGLLAALPLLTDFGWLAAHYGAAGTWIYLSQAVPQGWATAVMTYTLLTPRVLGVTGRTVTLSRFVLWSTLPALVIQQIPSLIYGYGFDTLEISGWLVLLVGLEMAPWAPAKLNTALQRLRARNVLGPAAVVDELRGQLRKPWSAWPVALASCVAIALLATSPWIPTGTGRLHLTALGPLVSLAVFFGAAGAVAGSWLGRMVSYGRLLGKANIRKHELKVQVIQSHPDGAGGLKPLGDFHLYQSLIASLPAIFLAVWVLLISLGGPNAPWGNYHSYLDQYLWLLILAILIEFLVFVLPMNSIHAAMKHYKEIRFQPEADQLFSASDGHVDDGPQLDADADAARQHSLEQYRELENAPTWPINYSIFRRFALTNLGLLVPVVEFLIEHTQFWRHL